MIEDIKYRVEYTSETKGFRTDSYFYNMVDAYDYYNEKLAENKKPILIEVKKVLTETVMEVYND